MMMDLVFMPLHGKWHYEKLEDGKCKPGNIQYLTVAQAANDYVRQRKEWKI